jgi:hypothetical protein
MDGSCDAVINLQEPVVRLLRNATMDVECVVYQIIQEEYKNNGRSQWLRIGVRN